jgi:hypothetical protein
MFRETRDLVDIERRMRAFEQRLDRLSRLAARESRSAVANLSEGSERVGEAALAALSDVVDRFRGNARSVGDEAARVGQQAARLSGDTLQRLSNEVEHRPLLTLAIAVGVGILIGFAGRRAS